MRPAAEWNPLRLLSGIEIPTRARYLSLAGGRRATVGPGAPREEPVEERPRRRDQHRLLCADPGEPSELRQRVLPIAEGVHEAEPERLLPRPELPGREGPDLVDGFLAFLRHELDEGIVAVGGDGQQLRPLLVGEGSEALVGVLVTPGVDQLHVDPEPVEEALHRDVGHDHPDGAHPRVWVRVDPAGADGRHVRARGAQGPDGGHDGLHLVEPLDREVEVRRRDVASPAARDVEQDPLEPLADLQLVEQPDERLHRALPDRATELHVRQAFPHAAPRGDGAYSLTRKPTKSARPDHGGLWRPPGWSAPGPRRTFAGVPASSRRPHAGPSRTTRTPARPEGGPRAGPPRAALVGQTLCKI